MISLLQNCHDRLTEKKRNLKHYQGLSKNKPIRHFSDQDEEFRQIFIDQNSALVEDPDLYLQKLVDKFFAYQVAKPLWSKKPKIDMKTIMKTDKKSAFIKVHGNEYHNALRSDTRMGKYVRKIQNR